MSSEDPNVDEEMRKQAEEEGGRTAELERVGDNLLVLID